MPVHCRGRAGGAKPAARAGLGFSGVTRGYRRPGYGLSRRRTGAAGAAWESGRHYCCGVRGMSCVSNCAAWHTAAWPCSGGAPQLALVASALIVLKDICRLPRSARGRDGAGFVHAPVLASLWLNQSGSALDAVRFVSVGSGMGALTALRQGRVHALCHSDPLITMLEQRGGAAAGRHLHKGHGRDVPAGDTRRACLNTRPRILQSHPADCRRSSTRWCMRWKWLQTASAHRSNACGAAVLSLGDRARATLAAFYKVRDPVARWHDAGDGRVTAVRAVARLQPSRRQRGWRWTGRFSNNWVHQGQKFIRPVAHGPRRATPGAAKVGR